MNCVSLRCEYLENPLGLDITQPRLSWQMQSARRSARQTAYQILAASRRDLLHENSADLWNSGKVDSDQSLHVEYSGAALKSRQRVWWMVRIWDEQGNEADSEAAWWEMGLLEKSDWQAQWIGSSLAGGPRTPVPCPFLRRNFKLPETVASARLYISALGLYECEINGHRVGEEDVFTPGWTDYHQRVQYQVYDVTDLLQQGENAIGAALGDGWAAGFVGWRGRQQYYDRPQLLAQLEVEYSDGTRETVTTDSTWNVAFGPLLSSDLIMGEHYDARREMPGWSTASFDEAEYSGQWQPVQNFEHSEVQLSGMRNLPVRVQQELLPIAEPNQLPDRKIIFDLGQNMVGRVRLKVSGPAGRTITLRYGEVLDENGNLYTDNLRTAQQTDHYTLKGDGEEVWESRFTFHGFRYVEMSGYHGDTLSDEVPPRDTIFARVLQSGMEQTGSWECSEPLLNQLQRNIEWGWRGNSLEVPTDCPQRDERLGWTGDAQVFIATAAFNCNVAPFFTKWQQDIADSQYEDGAVPCIVPCTENFVTIPYFGGHDGGPAWADATVICPWTVFQRYGDTRLLEEHYDSFVSYVEYLHATSRDLIRCFEGCDYFTGFGDWLSTDAGRESVTGLTSKELIGTAFFAHCANLLGQIAGVLGKSEDSQKYRALFEKVRAVFIERYVKADGVVDVGTQTSYLLALHFDLLPKELRPAAAAHLVAEIEGRGNHLSTGFVGSPYLNEVLTEMGYLDTAYKLLLQKEWPSWLYAVTQGATTIWERWDGWTHDKGFQTTHMNSFNHYAYGAIGDWMYGTVAGIRQEAPGFKKIVLWPHPGGELQYVKSAYDSLYGRVESSWKLDGNSFLWDVTIPPNTSATVYIPAHEGQRVLENGIAAEQAEGVTFLRREANAMVYEIGAGEYSFSTAS